MTNKITITVAGSCGSGKTTIADILYEFLVGQGFVAAQVQFEEQNEEQSALVKARRAQSVKDNAVIIIKEKQVSRIGL